MQLICSFVSCAIHSCSSCADVAANRRSVWACGVGGRGCARVEQTGPISIELLVVDDGSTDGTHDFLLELAEAMGAWMSGAACARCSCQCMSDLQLRVRAFVG